MPKYLVALIIVIVVAAVTLAIYLWVRINNSDDSDLSARDPIEEVISGTEDCQNLLNGIIEPFKDLQVFTDASYTEVTTTSREDWDVQKLPEQVVNLEGQGYVCFPLPLEYSAEDSPVAMEVVQEVTEVEWICELYWDDYKYLELENTAEMADLASKGYSCVRETCFADSADGELILCTK
ncbi:hypothetical protein ACFL0Z_01495 [Patescibacteria group bacterium]